MITKTRKFLREVRVELGKATWPWNPKLKGPAKYRELIDSTTVVCIAMVMIGAYVSLADYILATVLHSVVDWLS